MSGINVLSDTNPLIYVLDGNQFFSNAAAEFLDGKNVWISSISELELFGKKNLTPDQIEDINILLDSCFIVDINTEIKEITKKMLQDYPIKLPDAIIAATAQYMGFPVFTSDKAFKNIDEIDLILLEQ